MKKPKVKMGSVDFVLFATIMLLLAVGIVMVFSASSYTAGHSKAFKYDYMYFFKRQMLWALIGTVTMIAAEKYDYHKLKRFTFLFMIGTVILLLVVFAFPAINGAKRWIRLGPASFQPSEIAKYVIVLYLAQSLDNKGEKIKSFFYGVVPYLLVSGFFAGLILKEKNMSIASVIMIVTLIMLFTAGAKFGQLFGIVIPSLTALGCFFIKSQPYRYKRFISFLDPFADPQDKGFQLVQSLLALGSGGIWGVGIGRSRQKCYYLPEPHNDFIFSVIGEELGLVGCVFIIILFLIFIWRGIRIAVNAKDTYGTFLAMGITSVIAVQAIINVAVVSGAMPVTGVPLPFVSYGGSSLVFNLIAMGVLLNISRQCGKRPVKS